MKTLISLALFLILGIGYAQSQSPFENWNTLNVKGNFNSKLTIAIEGDERYNYPNRQVRYFHTDIGLIYKFTEKLSVGAYYRELYELKDDGRVMEVRPHLDFFYKFTDKWKVRIRNEYQIKEISDDLFRFRVRPTYKHKLNKMFSAFVQTEGFFVGTNLVRNRFNPGIAIKVNKIVLEPGYMLESNNKGEWSHIHIFWLNTKIKF